jgi:hypothetical protein
MTMMVAVPAVMMMMVVVVLGARRRNQRCQERKSKNSKRKLLHEIRPLLSFSFSNWKISLLIQQFQQSTQLNSP